jgi:hypothetical protein
MRQSIARVGGALLLFAGVVFVQFSTARAGATKVEVCHVPPGNPENFHTITVSEKALPAHIAHGDFEGPCNALCAVLCDDGDLCTMDDDGNCEDQGCPPHPREEVHCGDSTQCIEWQCYPDLGCVDEVLEGNPCDDGAVCTFSDVCDAEGECNGTTDEDCCPNDAACNATYCNGNFCDMNNECDSTGDPCVDDIQCTVDLCTDDPEGCENRPMDSLCDDEVACTDDTCDTENGCQFTPIDAECDDGLACTTDEYCDPVNGCQWTTNDHACDDGDDCTVDACDPSSPSLDGCRHTPSPGCCNEDLDCAPGQQCNSETGLCGPSCFTMLKAPRTTNVLECIATCEVHAGCDPGICDDKIASAANTQLVNNCINRSDYPNACLAVDNYGDGQGCSNICAPVSCNFPGSYGLVLDGTDWTGAVASPPEREALDAACVDEARAQGCGLDPNLIQSICRNTLLNSACFSCTRDVGTSPGACQSCGLSLSSELRVRGCDIVVPSCVQ